MAQAIKRGDTELYLSAIPFEVKEVEEQDRVLRFIGSDETPDRDNDIIEVAGWELANYRKNPVFLWAHDYRFPPIGRAIKVSKEEGGLIFDIEFPAEGIFPFADLVYNLYKGKFLRATSVGFIPKKSKPRDDDLVDESLPEWRRGTRYQKQELLELSAVPVPSNPNALEVARAKGYVTDEEAGILTDFINGKLACPTKACKALEGVWKAEVEGKGAIPYKETPKAPEDTEWNGPKEVAAADVDGLKIMCAWVDSENADKKGAYKLPHHRASDHYVVWNGVKAAMGALLGARGGVNIPEGDRKPVYNHLVKHYKQFDKEPPEFREYSAEELKALGFEVDEFIKQSDTGDFQTKVTNCARCGKDHESLQFRRLKTPAGNFTHWGTCPNTGEPILLMFMTVEDGDLAKAGAVLSRKNKDRLTQAQALIQEVLDSAEPAEEEDGDKETPEPDTKTPDGAPQADEIDLEGITAGQADEIDLEAIEAPNPAGGHELNIKPETLKALLKEVVKEELDRARGKVS